MTNSFATEDNKVLVTHDVIIALNNDQMLYLIAKSIIKLFLSLSHSQTRFLNHIHKFDVKLLKEKISYEQSSKLAFCLNDLIQVVINDDKMSQNLLIVLIDLKIIKFTSSQNVHDDLTL
jgi:hypothetical protein